MCAIVGSFAFNRSGFRVTEPFVVKMRDAMAHRGPDGSGVWISEDAQLGLGHRRLAIIDLSDSAAQPMQSDDASLVLVFNGEIYNHADIVMQQNYSDVDMKLALIPGLKTEPIVIVNKLPQNIAKTRAISFWFKPLGPNETYYSTSNSKITLKINNDMTLMRGTNNIVRISTINIWYKYDETYEKNKITIYLITRYL